MLTKEKYLQSLKNNLLTFGINKQQVSTIIADYDDYFEAAYDNNEVDTDIIKHLGPTKALAEQLSNKESNTNNNIPTIQLSGILLFQHPSLILPIFLYACLLLIIYLLQAFEIFFIFSPLILLIGLLLRFPVQGGVLLQLLISIAMMVTALAAFKYTQKGKLALNLIFKKNLWHKIS
ncbi:hypothetical protein ACVPPR_01635 [Dellaglioa sp. L3N]